jgi:hypothetical protein
MWTYLKTATWNFVVALSQGLFMNRTTSEEQKGKIMLVEMDLVPA